MIRAAHDFGVTLSGMRLDSAIMILRSISPTPPLDALLRQAKTVAVRKTPQKGVKAQAL
jgi:hypothetical protein